jgi:hypothetical protein
MILVLDHAIFGNGNGMKSPLNDDRFYWLHDENRIRPREHGQLYTFMHGLGAQLHSYQWTHPRPGERRRLAGREFIAFHSRRRWCRVEVAWAMVGLPRDLDEAHAAVRALEADLGRRV